MRATIITDASWCQKTKAGGWAAWVSPDRGFRTKQAGQFKNKVSSSNEAEILAAINGVFLAYRLGARILLLQSDCMGVQHAMDKRPLWKKAHKLHFPDAEVTFRHVKGHTLGTASRYYVNDWCDTHAKNHMRTMRNELKCT